MCRTWKEAARFLGDLRARVRDNLETSGAKTSGFVRQKIYEAVGELGGLNWLQDRDGNGKSIDDIVMTTLGDGITFEMKFMQAAEVINLPVDFDLGLPFLGLDIDGSVVLQAGFEWELGIGISKSNGLYLMTDKNVRDDNAGTPADERIPEMKFVVEATTPGLNANGKLGFLQIQATDSAADPTSVNATFYVDIKDRNGDGKLTLGIVGIDITLAVLSMPGSVPS